MTKSTNLVKSAVFEFKKNFYLVAAANRNFNIAKTCRELGAARGDFYNHLPRSKEKLIALARAEELV